MKSFLALALVVSSSMAGAARLKLKEFDQEKLADVIGRLSDEVKKETEVSIKNGIKITSTFPVHAEAYEITCQRFYYNGSPVPTNASCEVDLDANSNDYEEHNDQIKIVEEDGALASAIHSALPSSGALKKFYSSYYDAGVTFDGKKTNLFHYIISCSTTDCILWFSKKIESKQ